MKRREFVGLLGGLAAAWPVVARAQQQAMPVIGYLGYTTLEQIPDIVLGVKRGLAEYGFVEERNFKFEYRFAEGHPDRIAALAADLVQQQVDLIIMFAIPASGELFWRSPLPPIVFFSGGDPVRGGLVKSLNNPGVNRTGVAVLNTELTGKRLQLLHEVIPAANKIAYLGSRLKLEESEVQVAAHTLGLQILMLNADNTSEFERAIATASKENAGGVIVGQDALFQRNNDQLIALAALHRIPAIYASRISPAAGGLISYGAAYRDAYRTIGNYAGRILKGEKPADLPVQQVTKVELVINLKAAKALGIEIPASLLARADEVIE
jgi:putative tryptophan/tyrosine transport system substrate-binding protein